MKKLFVLLLVVSLVLAMPLAKTIHVGNTVQKQPVKKPLNSKVLNARVSSIPKTLVRPQPAPIDLCVASAPFTLDSCSGFEKENITVTFHNGTLYNGTGVGIFDIRDPEGDVMFHLAEGQRYYFLSASGKVLMVKLVDLITPSQAEVSYVWCPVPSYPRTITVRGSEQEIGDMVGTTHGGYGASVYISQAQPNPQGLYMSEYDYMYNWLGYTQVSEGDSATFSANGYNYELTYLSYVPNYKAEIQFVYSS